MNSENITIIRYNEGKDLEVFEELSDKALSSGFDRIWIDVEEEDGAALEKLAQRFQLHELSIEDCLTPGHLPKLEEFNNYLFFLFRGLQPPTNSEDGEEEPEEDQEIPYTRKVAIFAGQDFVITFRRKEVFWLDALVRQAKQNPGNTVESGTLATAYRVLDVLIDRFTRGLGYFERSIDHLEEQAFQEPEQFDIADIFELKRDLISIRKMSREQRLMIQRLSADQFLIRDEAQRRYFKDIFDHAHAIVSSLDQQVESLTGIRDSYFALANVRLGDTMRILAVITTLAVPLNIVVGMYGMNFEAIPLLHDPYGFWIVLSLMFILALLLLLYFKRKHWI